MVCARTFHCNLKEKRKWAKWKETKHSHSKCHGRRSAATIGKGWWRVRGDWSVIGGDMGDYLCGGGKSRMQLKFLRVSKNSNKNKGTHGMKCSCQFAATIGKGWWQACGDWKVIDGDLGDSQSGDSHGGWFDFRLGNKRQLQHTPLRSAINNQPCIRLQTEGQTMFRIPIWWLRLVTVRVRVTAWSK